ncbi:uncharacterized protein ARMOST_03098 [Armillaria ostoyae]|uniref:Aminotransferase class I/classII large domain-containing protein n=1 Tax=Armillaria ostoyae TaxID=47428 RepID=A0A284QTL0_ARMOS|nr:uncharacterized protein ARMOST_03098 [Armillaria ostoyae]
MNSYLEYSLQHSLDYRVKNGMPVIDLFHDTNDSCHAPDFFSNDYLSITTNKQLHDIVVKSTLSCTRLLGSTGSRVLNGNTVDHVELEKYLQTHFDASSALLWNSGYDANVAFFGSVPQKGDFILFDELIHASVRDGIAAGRASRRAYPFTHNSVASFEVCLAELVEKNPQISERKATVFLAVESLYSMDGDFSPLPEFIKVLHRYVPRKYTHVVVDEAHSTGICGPSGRGYVALLGLQNEVDTVLHTFGKARGSTGGESDVTLICMHS